MSEKVYKHKLKTMIFRSLNNINCEQLNLDLLEAPWHVSDIFMTFGVVFLKA